MHGKMPPAERLEATIALRPVDRVVCAPLISGYAASYAHVPLIRFVNDFETGIHCLDRLKAAFPGWDCNRSSYTFMGFGPLLKNWWFQKVLLPGEGGIGEDSPFQILEEELATQEELLAIRRKGFTRYMTAVTRRIRPEAGLLHDLLWEHRFRKYFRRECRATRLRGQSQYYGAVSATAFEFFSMTRSSQAFAQDALRIGDDLIEILDMVEDAMLLNAIEQCKDSGVPRVLVSLARCGPTLLSSPQFDRFVWPGLKKVAIGLIRAGLTPVFHVETDWGRVLERFLELPKGKCILELDGGTDIFRAKEVLRDHTCLSGNLSCALLTDGSPTEVEEACRSLISGAGKGGGFIFSTSARVPIASRHENVKAMFEAVGKYGRYD